MTTSRLTRILVPTDFSEGASQAIRYASDLARRIDAGLTIVYSDLFLPPVDFSATVGAWDETTFLELKARAEKQLKDEARKYVDPSVPHDTVVRIATTVDGILEQARDSGVGLIVMGTHGRKGFRRLVIGSVTEGVIRRSSVPVIAIPPGSLGSPIKTVVCPVLCDAEYLAALSFAREIVPPEARFIVIRATSAEVVREADDLVELRSWIPETIAPRCELRLFGEEHVAGQVATFAASAHADLMVAVESGDRSTADVLYGTFAVRLVQRSECPVLTANGPAMLAAAEV